MTEHFAMLAAWCGPDGPGLILGLFLAGLAGAPLHCAPMCGPFVLGQTADRLARIPAARLCEASRLRAGLLAPYHAGRLLTYAGLGATAGLLGTLPGNGTVGTSRLAGLMLLAGALLFFLHALSRLAPSIAPVLARILPAARAPAPLVRVISALTRRIDRTTPVGGLLLGVALGALPCGFLYAALAVAIAAGGPADGALAMLALGAGTIPTLVMIGLAGQAAGQVWRRAILAAAPALLLLNATLLAAAAWQSLFSA